MQNADHQPQSCELHAMQDADAECRMHKRAQSYSCERRAGCRMQNAECKNSPTARRERTEYRCLSLIHISEPTRQEAISYAVFCLKKKHANTTRELRAAHQPPVAVLHQVQDHELEAALTHVAQRVLAACEPGERHTARPPPWRWSSLASHILPDRPHLY